MTSFPDPVKSTALVVYTPSKHPLAKAEAHLQKMQNLFMDKSFKSQVADYQHFHLRKGDIVVITGIVAAGKSSITNAIKTVDPQFYEEDLDLRRDPETPTTPEMEMQMIDDTINRSLQGGKTIISLMHIGMVKKRAEERGITDLPVKTVLLHCPFSEISDRLETRNSAAEALGGDPKNYRNPLVPLDQFAALYLNRQDGGIETIERVQATAFFNSSFDKMVAHAKKQGDLLPPEEQIAIDKVQSRQEFLIQLGFVDKSQTQVRAAPRAAYDFVVDTSTCRDTASCVKIAGKLLQRMSK
jgi:shikimate kinase